MSFPSSPFPNSIPKRSSIMGKIRLSHVYSQFTNVLNEADAAILAKGVEDNLIELPPNGVYDGVAVNALSIFTDNPVQITFTMLDASTLVLNVRKALFVDNPCSSFIIKNLSPTLTARFSLVSALTNPY